MTLDSLVQWDHQATLWLNQLGNTSWDPFWCFLSDVQVWFPAYFLFVGFAFWRLGWKKGLVVLLSLILTVVLTDQLSVLVKNSVLRLRPCYTPWMLENEIRLPLGANGGQYGFFSSHASNTFGFAVVSYLSLKWNDPSRNYRIYGICVFIWAALVTFSRVMLAAHFLGDVLVGTFFGIVVGYAVVYAARWLQPKIFRPEAPRT